MSRVQSYITLPAYKVNEFADGAISRIRGWRAKRREETITWWLYRSEKRASSWYGKLLRLKPMTREEAETKYEQQASNWEYTAFYDQITGGHVLDVAYKLKKLAEHSDLVRVSGEDLSTIVV